MKLISPNNSYILYEDWEPLMQDIVDSHPGLKFLHDHKEFHSRYIKTVIARIYYVVNRSWSGKITLTELKRSNFLDVLESIEYEDDINLIRDFFSYEHFYVIYCKFWELDKDHDLFISREDLYRHNNYSISARVIDRIFSGTVISKMTHNKQESRDGLMSYYDFVWFLISEEDKRNLTSIEYWFRVLDVDGDGVLSMYELEYFYNEQIEQMRERQIEYMPFNDLLCQILDLVKPREQGKIRLKDLKQCKMTNVFFDTFINLEKYLEYEQRDPFANMRDLDSPEQSDWDKYAAEEYENLVSEDVNGDNQDM
jgi:serine/threonine-protein phosphatase 2A regulatory subunit B''